MEIGNISETFEGGFQGCVPRDNPRKIWTCATVTADWTDFGLLASQPGGGTVPLVGESAGLTESEHEHLEGMGHCGHCGQA